MSIGQYDIIKNLFAFQVWFRVIQVVINRDDIQGYAAKTVFEALQSPTCHENMVRVGGYILGEFGNLIAGDHRSRYDQRFDCYRGKKSCLFRSQ